MALAVLEKILHHYKSGRFAGYAAVAIAAALPWSTSVTAAFIAIWFVAYIPQFNMKVILGEIFSWRGGLPLLLCGFAILGVFWSEASWHDTFIGLRQFQKVLFIPLTIAYFRHSEYGVPVIIAFASSCIVLLLVALTVTIWPEIQWWRSRYPGVPVKTYISQSAVFGICGFCFLFVAWDQWQKQSRYFALIAFLVALTFLADILFIITSRTELVVIAVLVVLLFVRLFGWRGFSAGMLALTLLSFVAWNTSTYLRGRMLETKSAVESYFSETQTSNDRTISSEISSTAYRIEFLRRSYEFITLAPFFGHGTGSIKPLFQQSAAGRTGVSAAVTDKPHSQIASIAIQLGAAGTLLLVAMWVVHALMFFSPGMLSSFGLVLVTHTVIGSLFNDHLFDFTEGWLYVCGIGVLGGTCLRRADLAQQHSRNG
jgi:O-antigen ligase